MQATATVKQTQRKQIWIATIVVMLLGVLAVGAAVATFTRNSDPTSNGNASALARPNTNANFRLLEMNMLPEAAAVRPLTYQQYRFLEMNALPQAAVIRPLTFQQYRLREMNELPEATPAPVMSLERWHLLEINTLPGDHAPLVAPFGDRLGERY